MVEESPETWSSAGTAKPRWPGLIEASLRKRGQDRAHIGTRLIEPNINYAKMAETYGMHGEGPLTDPNDLQAVLQRSVELAKKGEPVLIDVVTQPR